MAQSIILKKILKLFAKKLWPWFKDNIWPLLREHVLETFSSVFAKLKEKIKEYLEGRSSQRQDEARQKSQQAEENARNATDPAERKTYEAVARVWREVAEQFREENEALKEKIQELTTAAEAEIVQRTRDSNPTVDTTSDTPVLVLGERRTSLPALPSRFD
jgi:valyl-tRNA synthetase